MTTATRHALRGLTVIVVLVGSPRWAVWDYTHDDNPPYAPLSGPHELVARSSTGHQDKYPLTAEQQSLDSLRWSLSGDLLTTIDSTDHSTVNWWNLSTGVSGTLVVPKSSYVAAYT